MLYVTNPASQFHFLYRSIHNFIITTCILLRITYLMCWVNQINLKIRDNMTVGLVIIVSNIKYKFNSFPNANWNKTALDHVCVIFSDVINKWFHGVKKGTKKLFFSFFFYLIVKFKDRNVSLCVCFAYLFLNCSLTTHRSIST